jgi:hypothetical protein
MMPRAQLRTTDRLLLVGLPRVWTGWRQALVIVSPDTGRPPPVNAEIKALVRRMAAVNSLWGSPAHPTRLVKLGVDVPSAPSLD